MSDTPHWSFDRFDAAAADLRARGHEVVSPAELDDPRIREAAFKSTRPLSIKDHTAITGETWADLLARDIKRVVDGADGVVVLPGWTRSRGTRLETFAAFVAGKSVYHYPTMRPVRRTSLARAWLGEWAHMLAKVRIK